MHSMHQQLHDFSWLESELLQREDLFSHKAFQQHKLTPV